MSTSNCCFLTCIQISQEAIQVVWYSYLFQNFPQFIVIHTVKGFGIVSQAEVDFFWNSLVYRGSNGFGNLISGSSAFPKTNLNIWKFMVHILLKPGLEKFEHFPMYLLILEYWINCLYYGLPTWLNGKDSFCQVVDADLTPEFRRSTQEVYGNSLQYSSWRIPRTEEPGGLQSIESQKSQT